MIYLSFRNFLFFIIFFLGTASAFAQSRVVTGRVVDNNDGSGLPAVNIVEKGTSNGTVSDADGNFTITVQDKAVLVFSFIGFTTQEITVGDVSSINVKLTSATICLIDQMESVGYGIQGRRSIGGAVSGLEFFNFNRGNIYDPAQLWQGRVAGLSTYNRGGDPNVESFVRIRGMTSFDANSRPLIVIDGVPAASLNNVDPNDIESISVLKDGAAAAIYGMRGSAGVIEVNSKRGSIGGLSATYHGYVSAASVTRTQPLLSPSEFIAAGGSDAGSATDWQDEITRTGVSSAHSISIGGASNQSSFRASLNFREVNGILLHSGFDQVNGRVGFTHRALRDRLRLDFNLAFTNRESNFSFPEAFRYIYFNPTAPIRFPNGNFYQPILFDNYNPVALLELNTNRGKRKNSNYNVKAAYSITENLTATVQYAQQFEEKLNGTYYSRNDFTRGLRRGGLAQRYAEQSSFSLVESYLSYFKQFNSTSLAVLAGYSYQQDDYENLSIELGNFPNDALGFNALETSGDRLSGDPFLVNISSTAYPLNKLTAGFARINVNHKDIWSFNFSLRRETSNRLGSNNNTGIFSAAALNADLNRLWSLSLNALNARLSYGITGALPSQPGLSQDLFQYQLNKFQGISNGGTVVRAHGANPDLKWEQKKEMNVGFDFGIDRLYGSLDFYKRTTKDIIQRIRVIDVQSYSQYQNTAGLEGRGIEITVNYSLGNYGSWQWNPGLILSANRTLVDGFENEFQYQNGVIGVIDGGGCDCGGVIRWAKGEKVGQFWAPIFDGVASNGNVILKDFNGDGRIDPLTERGVAGYANPSIELGWSNLIKFRQWDLNAFFRGVFGHSLLNVPRLLHEPNNLGTINTWNHLKADKAVEGIAYSPYSTLYVEKADFLKLDNITLGYTFKSSPSLRNFRMYAAIQNAFVITNYTGVDPEPVFIDGVRSATYTIDKNVLVPGVDRKGGYFPARTFTLGLTLGF